MQHHGGAWPGLRHRPSRVCGLAILQHATEPEGCGRQVGKRMPGCAPLLAHRLDLADASCHVADEIDPAGREFCCQSASAWTIGREMQRDAVAGIEKVELRIEEADLAPLAFHFEVDGF